MIQFACPGCSTTFTVGDEMAGKTETCSKCSAQFVIPDINAAIVHSSPSKSSSEIEIQPCPGCQAKLVVAASDLGLDVECPYCLTNYRATKSDNKARTQTVRKSDRAETRKRDEDEEYDDDFEIDEKKQRRKYRRKLEKAESVVSGPAIGLMIVGALGIIYGLLAIVAYFLVDNAKKRANLPDESTRIGYDIGYFIGSFLPIFWGIIVFIAGYKFKTLSSRMSVILGTVCAFLPCNLCCLLGIPFGIWAWMVLIREDVKEGFDISTEREFHD